MKKLLVLLFSLLISFNSYGQWSKVTESGGEDFYIDFDTIKEQDGYVYWWVLTDYLKPTIFGMSDKNYNQGDCEMNRIKSLSLTYYREPMGRGSGETHKGGNVWGYPPPDSVGGILLNWVCHFVD